MKSVRYAAVRMPQIVDYDRVTAQAQRQGLRSLYYNSGAFGFPPAGGGALHAVGWISGPDPSIRPAALALTRTVAAPAVPTLVSLAARAWRQVLPGPVWVMPKSHWAYELDFGSAAWMPGALSAVGIDPAALADRTDGSAIEFADTDHEAAAWTPFVEQLLTNLAGGDFALMFPGRPALCTVHHHKQLWWTTTDAEVFARLDSLVPRE